MTQAARFGQEPRGSDAERIREMFARLKPDTPGLGRVQDALARGGPAAAESAYFEYWKTREKPVFVWGAPYSDGNLKFRSAHFDFFEPRLLTFSRRDRAKLAKTICTGKGWDYYETQELYTVIELADMLLENRYFHPWWPAVPPQEMGDSWDWSRVPPTGDLSWTCHLNRQEFYRALGQAYWLTGDERYARKLVDLLTGWIGHSHHGRSRWGSAEFFEYQALGPIAWTYFFNEALQFLADSPSLTAHHFCVIQAWLTTDNVDRLVVDPREGNQLMGTACSMLYTGALLPEFRDASGWVEQGDRRLARFLGDAVYPDGGFAEATFSYNWGSSISMMYAWIMAQKNGIALQSVTRERLLPIAEYFVLTARPDWQWPWTGDGGRGSACNLVRKILELFPACETPELRHFASRGRQGTAPARSSAWFAWPGYCVMKDRYAPDANYLFFDVGPTGIVHYHADKLAVEVSAFGRSLLEDIGIHTYSTDEKEWPQQRLATATWGHNSVTVDGGSQVWKEERGKAPVAAPWVSSGVLDFNAGQYAGPYVQVRNATWPVFGGGEVENVVHHRSVVFVKPDYWIITDRVLPKKAGTREMHTYEQYFHFIPVEVSHDPQTMAAWSATPGRPNLAIVPVRDAGLCVEIAKGQEEPELQGWYYYPDSDAPVVAAPCVILRQRGNVPAILQTVVFPLREGEWALPKVERLGDPANGALRVALPDGRADLYAAHPRAGRYRLGDLEFDGLAALVRMDTRGRVAAREIVRPE